MPSNTTPFEAATGWRFHGPHVSIHSLTHNFIVHANEYGSRNITHDVSRYNIHTYYLPSFLPTTVLYIQYMCILNESDGTVNEWQRVFISSEDLEMKEVSMRDRETNTQLYQWTNHNTCCTFSRQKRGRQEWFFFFPVILHGRLIRTDHSCRKCCTATLQGDDVGRAHTYVHSIRAGIVVTRPMN